MVTRLVLVLGDQLSENLSALKAGDKAQDVVVMAEVADEATYVQHHPQKIALVLAAMRKFAARLRKDGWEVRYTKLDDPDAGASICSELLRRAEETGASEVIVTTPGEWRLIEVLRHCPLKVRFLADDRFVASRSDFEDWAKGRKQLRMEYFYREMRRKTGLLMDGDKPAGGKWNFDSENRKRPPKTIFGNGPMRFAPDETVKDVLDLVEARFDTHFGALHPFEWATDQAQARCALSHFVKNALPCFGDYQDAMLRGESFLYHAGISAYLNIGLLDPMEVCEAAVQAWQDGAAPLNAVEGFVRQIIGWREYVRGIYYLQGPDYTASNALDLTRDLPPVYWGGETDMLCMAETVAQTRDKAYAHHIQRLMVTGNFALLAGIDPDQVHQWYLSVYIDAFEWVEAPNTIGMSQFADGGIVASKPYVSSGAYINRMSDYCKHCAYNVNDKTGDKACPFNLLYWSFLDRNRAGFKSNTRMGNMYRTLDRMDASHRDTVLAEAQGILEKLDRGERL